MNKTVLIVDDDPIVRLVIQKMIRDFDGSVKCHQSENGELGLEVFKKLLDTADFLAVLLDINMPVLDGWGFLVGLQEINIDSTDIFQIYIVTSSTDESDKLKAKSYPLIRRLLHKPLSRKDIEEILMQKGQS